MLNFRFHVVSLVAVFLALAIGIIMGSTVIDRALVDTLEDQQQALRGTLDDLTEENTSLRRELDDLREGSERLASEGGERLLADTLADVPVLVVAVRGVDTAVLDDLVQLLDTAGAVDQGTLWLTDRLLVDDEGELADLAESLGVPEGTASAEELRTATVQQVAAAIRGAVQGGGTSPDGQAQGGGGAAGSGLPGAGASLGVLIELRSAGFLEYDAPDGGPDDVADLAVAGTRVVLVSGATAEVPDVDLAVPLARALVARGGSDEPAVALLAAEAVPPIDADVEAEPPVQAAFVGVLREDDVGDRLSTVDNLDAFAGRLAAVVAIQDLGAGRRGHYGVGPGLGELKITGALIQKYRGPVRAGSSGYGKNYVYDQRLRYDAPPKFLNPTISPFGAVRTAEARPQYR